MMKKIIALLLAVLCCASLFSCAQTGNEDKKDDTTDAASDSTAPEAPVYPEVDYGLNDVIENFTPTSKNDRIMEGTYTKVSDIDKQYVQNTKDGLIYLRYSTPQFALGGIKAPADNNNEFYRLDAYNKNNYSNLNQTSIKDGLAYNTSGATLRFRTNAKEFTIYAMLRNCTTNCNHFSDRGAHGFDVYVGSGSDRVYCGTKGQLLTDSNILRETVKLPGEYVEVMINFPMYGGIQNIALGFDGDAEIAEPLERDYKPIVIYGSSITQGACASRPGTAFPNMVTRMLNADCINQGYSSGAHLETVMAEYIASLEGIGAVVIDNGGNGSLETLRTKHYKFYKIIRDAHPDIPIILVSRPIYKVEKDTDDNARIAVMQATYDRAVKEGDKNVYFVSGYDFMDIRPLADLTTVDGTHPNDLGMYYMACTIYQALYAALNKAQ